VVEAFQAELRRDGIGEPTILKTLTLLQGILQRAVVWGRIRANPVAPVRKPVQKRKHAVRPVAPTTVEQIRRTLIARRRALDATLVSVLAYAGLRPGEALALCWGHIGERTILVERAAALGARQGDEDGPDPERPAPQSSRPRSARVAVEVGSSRPGRARLPPVRRRGLDRRGLAELAAADLRAGGGLSRPQPVPPVRSPTLVSLLFAEGRTVIEVARQAGHSPTMALATYGHVIEELEGAERRPAEEVIREARARGVPSEFPQRAVPPAGRPRMVRKVAANRGKPSDGLEPSTPSLPCAPIGNWSQPVATVLA
jgi:integrase